MASSGPRLLPPTPDEGTLWLTWLVRLRWLALFAQLVTLAFVFNMLDGVNAIVPWAVVMLLLGLANLLAVARMQSAEEIPARNVAGQLVLDVLSLTALFLVAGGPSNPFTPLYLVHIAMAAVMLPQRHAGLVGAVVVAGYSSLFAFHLPLHYGRHSLPESVVFPLGQWLAFTITTLSVAVFVVAIATSLRRRKEQLLDAQERSARTDRLRSLGTLAAGAAHELNTPLSTISLRARRIGRRHVDPETTQDLMVLDEQLARCTSIVTRLLVGAGDPAASDIELRPLGVLVSETARLWAKGTMLELKLQDVSDGLQVELPRVAFQQALVNLLENAREAQEEVGTFAPIRIRVRREGPAGVVEIHDLGVGLPGTADQVGEPFFTTKPTGTGLGVFVARQIADGAGGGLHYAPGSRGGTVAHWWFPEAATRPATGRLA